jgi:hypothetical protein
MQGTALTSNLNRAAVGLTGLVVMALLGGCTATLNSALSSALNPEPPLEIQLYQRWELQPGDTLSGYTVLGGLGDITLALNGKPIYAPFDGKTQWDARRCIIFSTPEVPAYLFRLCGLNQPKLGAIAQGDPLGTATILQFAALRKQANNQWAMVEPSKTILQRALTR